MQKYGGRRTISNELSDLVRRFPGSVESTAWFLIAKCKRRDKQKEEIFNKKESRLSASEIF